MEKHIGKNRINIYCIIKDVFRDLWIAILVGLSCAMLAYIAVNITYRPMYTSSTTFVVSAKSGINGPYENLSKVNKLTEVFQSVMGSNVLKKLSAEEAGMDYFEGDISIAVVPETNLLTVSVTSASPEKAFRLLNAMLVSYPTVGEDVFGDVVLEVFEEPAYPSRPNERIEEKKAVLYGFLLGVIAIVALLAFISYMKDTVKDSNDITEKLDTTEFAVLHHEKQYKNLKDFFMRKKKLLLLTEPTVGFGYSETIKKMRTKLVYNIKKRGTKVLYVTSTVSGEGKTTVAMNIAAAMSKRYKKVLLIEGDLSKHDISSRLSIEEADYIDWGLSLVTYNDIRKAVYKVPNHDFYVLMNSSVAQTPSKHLASLRMKEFMEWARQEMDFIVIDGTPSRKRADSEILARMSDASLLVVKQNKAQVKFINDTIDMLNGYGEGLLGCVFNDVMTMDEIISYGYGYGYGVGYGYGYGRYGKYGKYGKYGQYGKYGNYYAQHLRGEKDGSTEG